MRLTKQEAEAVEYLREWAAWGFPKRVDGSFPVDFLTAMRRLMKVPKEKVSSRDLEELLVAGPDFDHKHPKRTFYWHRRGRELMGVTDKD